MQGPFEFGDRKVCIRRLRRRTLDVNVAGFPVAIIVSVARTVPTPALRLSDIGRGMLLSQISEPYRPPQAAACSVPAA
jgi:hypothetical protein